MFSISLFFFVLHYYGPIYLFCKTSSHCLQQAINVTVQDGKNKVVCVSQVETFYTNEI